MSSSRALKLALVALVIAAVSGVGAYLIGKSSTENLADARSAGEREGHTEGTSAGTARGLEDGREQGRKAGYRETYKKAYRKAFREATPPQPTPTAEPSTPSSPPTADGCPPGQMLSMEGFTEGTGECIPSEPPGPNPDCPPGEEPAGITGACAPKEP